MEDDCVTLCKEVADDDGKEDDEEGDEEDAEDASAKCWTRNSMCGISSASHRDWMCEPKRGSWGPIIATTPDDIW